MSEQITLEPINSVHMKVVADSGTLMELAEQFSFRPEGYQFVPAYKNRVWDGIIRLFQPMRPIIYVGLYPHIKKFCDDRGYFLSVPDHIGLDEEFDDDYPTQLAEEIDCKFIPRDYQTEYVLNALRKRRSLSLSPTSSGKSLIIYLIQQHYYQAFGLRTLIIVPTIYLLLWSKKV